MVLGTTVLRLPRRRRHQGHLRHRQFYEKTVLKVTEALRARDPALILHCEPAPGLKAAAASLIGPDDVVLNLASGVYGKGFGYWSARYNKELFEIEVPYNEAIDPAAVEAAFKSRSAASAARMAR